METKKFFTGLTNDKNLATFLQKENLIDFAILNIERGENGIFKFTTITDFHKIEFHELDKAGQQSFELFQNFRNSKNAIACILKAIESNGDITPETFQMQSKITPTTAIYTEEAKKCKTFGEFWAILTPEQKATFGTIADKWATEAGYDMTNFEFFHINGENGIELKAGQFLKLTDSVYGQKLYAIVTQVSPNGFISVMDGQEIFTLGAETAKKLEILDPKKVPAETKEFFDLAKTNLDEELQIRKTAKIEIAMKAKAKADEAQKIAEAKAEKLKKATEEKEAKAKASADEMEALLKESMTTKEEVSKVVEKINAKAETLLPEHKKALSQKVAEVRASFKKVSETIKTATPETAPAETKAEAGTEATPEAKTTSRPQRNKAKAETSEPAK